jgi:hypothetical protein
MVYVRGLLSMIKMNELCVCYQIVRLIFDIAVQMSIKFGIGSLQCNMARRYTFLSLFPRMLLNEVFFQLHVSIAA